MNGDVEVAAPREREGATVGRMRRSLLALAMAGTAGITLDLALIEHTESALQWTPFAALGVGLPVQISALLRPGALALKALRVMMVLFAVLGALGIYLHLRGNLLFELEMEPDARWPALVWKAARGGVPTLAPAGLLGLGLVGWIATLGHPSLDRENR